MIERIANDMYIYLCTIKMEVVFILKFMMRMLPFTSNPLSRRLFTGCSSFICFTIVLLPDSPAPSSRILTIWASSENAFFRSREIYVYICKDRLIYDYLIIPWKDLLEKIVISIIFRFTCWDLTLASFEFFEGAKV